MYNIYVYMYTQFIFLFIAALLCFAFSDGFVCYKKTTTTTTTIIKLSTNRDQLMLYSIFACCLQLFVEPNVYCIEYTQQIKLARYRVFAYKTHQYDVDYVYTIFQALVAFCFVQSQVFCATFFPFPSSPSHCYCCCVVVFLFMLLLQLSFHLVSSFFGSHFGHTSVNRRTKHTLSSASQQ